MELIMHRYNINHSFFRYRSYIYDSLGIGLILIIHLVNKGIIIIIHY